MRAWRMASGNGYSRRAKRIVTLIAVIIYT
jgi:hypothetical protein